MSKRERDDPYRRSDYRRMVAWPARIEREWPLLERTLKTAPEPSVIDLGCGTGEHCRALAARGFRALGVDRSESQIEQARDYENEYPAHGPAFQLGDFTDLPELLDERFGAAICLGNALPHLEDETLERALLGLHEVLLPGGVLLLQLLNYERILVQDQRYLPLNFRENPDGEGEIVFIRFMTRDGERHIRFNPVSLALHPQIDPPVVLKNVKGVRLRAWTRPELGQLLESCGFEVREEMGDMEGAPYAPAASSDLVVAAASR